MAAQASAQNEEIRGIVVDSVTQQPLAQVIIELKETGRQIKSDQNGRFIFRPLAEAVHPG